MGAIREEISKNIKIFRDQAGFTQKQLADAIGVGPPAISNWENATNSPDIETLFKISEALSVSIDDLYGKCVKVKETEKPATIADDGFELSAKERRLIELFRQVPDESEDLVLRMIAAALENLQSQ